MKRVAACVCAAAAGWLASAGAVRAEVMAVAADGFHVRSERESTLSPDELWRRLVSPRLWWSDAHTWSGDAGALRLTERAGGCWCETWPGGTAEHGRVVFIEPPKTLRLDAALGPLQELGVAARLSFAVSETPAGSRVTAVYRVSGAAGLKLDQLAAPVDGVLAEQVGRLVAP
jgi:hypothetical protein